MNLLGGRARTRYLHPLTWREFGAHFKLDRALTRGVLPSIYFSDDPKANLDDHTAIEVKAKENVSAHDLRSLRALAEEKKLKRYLCVSLEPRRREVQNISILPYPAFFEALWRGEYSG